MRYAIFSDVHANRQAWEAVREDAERMQADTLVCLGDVVGYGPKPLEVLTAVREATPNFVLGNHDAAACGRLDPSIFNDRARTVIEWTRDRLDEEALEFLNQVPLQMDGAGVLFVHAEVMEPGEFGYVDGPGPAQMNLRAMTKPIGFLGHTHLPMAYSIPKKGGQVTQLPPKDFQVERAKRTLVNVGSVGEPRSTDVRASYVIYDDAEKTVTFRKVQFDVEAYKADLEETGLDIRPYFVQVVEAGKVAGAPEPAAAPQMALAHLPKVAEVVAGHHGQLVLGRPGGAPAWGAPSAAALPSMQRTKGFPGWAIAAVVALLLVCVSGIAIYASRKDNELAVQPPPAPGPPKDKSAAPRRNGGAPGAAKSTALANQGVGVDKTDRDLPIKRLVVKVFARDFKDLDALREAEEKETPDQKQKVEDGLISPDLVKNHVVCGVVWEGDLFVPKTGVYEFTLDSASGAALFLGGFKEKEFKESGKMGRAAIVKVRLRGGHPSLRLEVVRKDAEDGLSLTWSGPGFEGERSLVRAGSGSRNPPPAIASEDPEERPIKPKPQRELEAAEKLSQDLVSFWSFDTPGRGEGRLKVNPDGTAVEKLVAVNGQRVQVLVPTGPVGSKWKDVKFDAKDWKLGENGVGYGEKTGPFKDLIKTDIGKKPRKQPHSVYIRIPFEVEDPTVFTELALMMKYDDGFDAYLNGAQMASRNLPDKPAWNAAAKKANENPKPTEFQPFKVSSKLKDLKKGWNVLAIQAFNASGEPNDTNTGSTSSDMLILPELLALRKDVDGLKPPPQPNKHEVAVKQDDRKGKVTLVPGKFGDAYDFDEGSIEVGSKDDYAIGDGSFTISLWFTRDPGSEDNQARRLISAGGGGAKKAGWGVRLTKKMDGVTFAVSDGNTRSEVQGKDQSISDGEWRHVAVTVNRPPQMVSIFIDGKLVGDGPCKVLAADEIPSGSGLSIGKSSDLGNHHRGKLDDIAIWKRALAPEEVKKIFRSGMAGKPLGEILDEKAE